MRGRAACGISSSIMARVPMNRSVSMSSRSSAASAAPTRSRPAADGCARSSTNASAWNDGRNTRVARPNGGLAHQRCDSAVRIAVDAAKRRAQVAQPGQTSELALQRVEQRTGFESFEPQRRCAIDEREDVAVWIEVGAKRRRDVSRPRSIANGRSDALGHRRRQLVVSAAGQGRSAEKHSLRTARRR